MASPPELGVHGGLNARNSAALFSMRTQGLLRLRAFSVEAVTKTGITVGRSARPPDHRDLSAESSMAAEKIPMKHVQTPTPSPATFFGKPSIRRRNGQQVLFQRSTLNIEMSSSVWSCLIVARGIGCEDNEAISCRAA